MNSVWLQRPDPRPAARARLFCFPYAGVGASIYRPWSAGLPEQLELTAVQLPGRANRLHEPAIASIPTIVDALVSELLSHLDLPFAFFGHSMGAVLAYEVTRALASRDAPLPGHLVVSARRPPQVPHWESLLHGLPDHEFVAEIDRRYGGIPAEVLQHADLLALLLPSLRADITALETFRPGARPPVSVPITALGGAEDRHAPRPHLDAWRGETTGAFRVRVFPGDHFYLNAQRAAVLSDLSATLVTLTGAALSPGIVA